MDKLVKIVITGPESSGKSFLCTELARHFKTLWVPEYARLYLEKKGPAYDLDTLNQMAREHIRFQRKHLKQTQKLIFLDTDLINYKVWSTVVFGITNPWILKCIEKEKDHKYLITVPDLPWESDPLRENPHNRQHIFDLHLREVTSRFRPYRIVHGYGETRVKNAIEAVKQLLRF